MIAEISSIQFFVFFVALDLKQVKYLLTILCSDAALLAIYDVDGKITRQSRGGRKQSNIRGQES